MTERDSAGDRIDDVALVERMRAGDEAAFDVFAGTYHAPLLRYVLSCLDGDMDQSRELVQTALCKAIGKLDTFRGEASLFTWLRACCRNEVLMLLRRKRSMPRMVGLESADSAPLEAGAWIAREELPEQRLLRAEKKAAVHVALDLLPERYARALEWKYFEGLPVVEIAERLELSPKAAESLLTRARGAFRARYDEASRPPIGKGPWT